MPVQPSKPGRYPSNRAEPPSQDCDKLAPTSPHKERPNSGISLSKARPASDTESGYYSNPDEKLLSERITSLSISDSSDYFDSPGNLDDFVFSPCPSSKPHFDYASPYKIEESPFAKGRFGHIYKVTQWVKQSKSTEPSNQNTQAGENPVHTFALKVAPPPYSLVDEQLIMESLPAHPNIVGYEGFISLGDKSGLMFEFLDGPQVGSLIENLCSSGLPANELFNAWKYLEQQKFQAIAHTHQHNIMHSDLKPDNFHFHKPTMEAKLIDFGGSVKLGEPAFCGHECYAAPEALDTLLKGKTNDILAHPSMDCYSMGQMIYRDLTALQGKSGDAFCAGALLAYISPKEQAAKAFIIKNAMKENYLSPSKDGSYKAVLPIPSPEISIADLQRESIRISRKELIGPGNNRISTWEPEGFEPFRHSAEHFKMNEIMLADLINGLMHPVPEMRTTASEALQHPWFTNTPVDEQRALNTLQKVLA